MRILITGAGGFVGRHLSAHLAASEPGAALIGTTLLPHETVHPALRESQQINLVDEAAVRALVDDCRPDFIYHLAAQAFVPRSFDDPWETLENNIRAQLNIIRACLALDIRPRILVVSSAEIYGSATTSLLPMDESAPIRPTNPYSVSKVAQDMLALQYHLSHGLPIMRARPFNHIGPGQNARFVAPAFALQIAKIEANRGEAVIYVGNLSAKRDFTDVRDIVRGYHLIAARGKAGEAYNIASGEARSIESLLDTLLALSAIDIEARVDPARLRPVDVPEIRGDASKLREDTGWQPRLSFKETLRDVLVDCRRRVQQGEI
ncbi:MAG: GDP-mannose 4,6-dehydratase [Chloroflexi bacterium]|nr:GDP-mannose 4,6-dehydratase [Chloroflexota bacterium]